MLRYHQPTKTSVVQKVESKIRVPGPDQGGSGRIICYNTRIHPFMLSRWRNKHRDVKVIPDNRARLVQRYHYKEYYFKCTHQSYPLYF